MRVEIRKAGYALSVYTINDGDVARALVGMGVDCVITDAPDVILRGAAPELPPQDLKGLRPRDSLDGLSSD